jgi:hypothetical protein
MQAISNAFRGSFVTKRMNDDASSLSEYQLETLQRKVARFSESCK